MFKLGKVWLSTGILALSLGAFLTTGIAFAAASGIKGVVLSKDSSVGISVAKVKLFTSKNQYTTTTGAGGIFSLQVPSGIYEVEVSHPAYQTLYSEVKIISGKTIQVSWPLTRKINLDLGWYSGTGPTEREKYGTLSEDVNTVILYTKHGNCDHPDIKDALDAMPDRIGVWLEVPYKFHIEA
jgi:hypothetical protein